MGEPSVTRHDEPELDPHTEVSTQDASAMLGAGGVSLFLDVRSPAEVEVAAIDGATVVSMSELPGQLDRLDEHRGGKVVVFCHHGGRSLRVTRLLRQSGFGDVWSMAGGIDAWSRQVDPTVPRY